MLLDPQASAWQSTTPTDQAASPRSAASNQACYVQDTAVGEGCY